MTLLQPFTDLQITLADTGAGERTTLVLHGGSGPRGVTPIIEHFSPHSRVLAPTHPGWDGTTRPDWFTGVGSLAVTYLDLLDDEDLTDVTVIASSFAGYRIQPPAPGVTTSTSIPHRELEPEVALDQA
jgi:pimeloyl-ACP methyl ester carboxylesterase